MKRPDLRPACVTNQLSRGEAQGQGPLYVLTKEDVDGVAKTIGLRSLTDEHYRMARKYMESFCGDSAYDWELAITDALKDAEREIRSEYSDS